MTVWICGVVVRNAPLRWRGTGAQGGDVRTGSRESWQIGQDLDYALALVLFVRDVTGLRARLRLPQDVAPLEPAVALDLRDVHDGVDDATVEELQRWWTMALEQPAALPLLPNLPGWDGMDALPDARDLAERLQFDFWQWLRPAEEHELEQARSDGLHLTHFVNGLETELRRPVRPFRLRIRVIPVGGTTGWILDDNQVLVTPGLRDDATALTWFLRPVVSALA